VPARKATKKRGINNASRSYVIFKTTRQSPAQILIAIPAPKLNLVSVFFVKPVINLVNFIRPAKTYKDLWLSPINLYYLDYLWDQIYGFSGCGIRLSEISRKT
jgi:hypothetical protein